jgi:cellulose synthase/poly-beta-1,6-N-acetylglucosamine synthase-like glycosyltransferase
MATPVITVGTVAFNEGRSIARTLQSILVATQSLGSVSEVIVVASGCSDQTVEQVRRVVETSPTIQLVDGTQRLSKCEGLNVVAERARGKILIFIDADLIVHDEALRILSDAFAQDPSLSVAYGRMVPTKGTSRLWTTLGAWTASALDAIRGLPDGSGLWLVCGPLFAVRASAWANLPKGLMSDDVYIGLSAQSRGLRIRYLRNAIAYGLYPQTLRDYLDQKLRNRMARIQLRMLEGDALRNVPLWIGGFALKRLRWSAMRHLPILLVDGALSTIALSQWLCGRRPSAIWNPIQSTKPE